MLDLFNNYVICSMSLVTHFMTIIKLCLATGCPDL